MVFKVIKIFLVKFPNPFILYLSRCIFMVIILFQILRGVTFFNDLFDKAFLGK